MFRFLAILSCLCVAAGVAWAEGDPANGKKLIKKWDCITCHGLSGNNRSSEDEPVPMLAGQPAGYLIKAINEYKSGPRIDTDNWSRMSGRVKGLSDQDIEDIAAHYAAQKRF
jgi:cytochrome c553